MATLIEVLSAFQASEVTFKTLTPQRITPESVFVGNHAVVCRSVMEGSGEVMSLKCYPRPRRNTPFIYGESFLCNEAGIYTLNAECEYLDIVAEPWIDGCSLDTLFRTPQCDYALLSRAFDSMAVRILRGRRAHGDIKPENLILTPEGEMHLIDYDAAWVPGLVDGDIEEVGTPAFSHPLRLGRCFDAYIDDYPIALISTMLAALSYDREYFEPHITDDYSLFSSSAVYFGVDRLFNMAMSIFERKRDAVHYQIACSLCGSDGHIVGLADMLEQSGRLLPKIPRVKHE